MGGLTYTCVAGDDPNLKVPAMCIDEGFILVMATTVVAGGVANSSGLNFSRTSIHSFHKLIAISSPLNFIYIVNIKKSKSNHKKDWGLLNVVNLSSARIRRTNSSPLRFVQFLIFFSTPMKSVSSNRM